MIHNMFDLLPQRMISFPKLLATPIVMSFFYNLPFCCSLRVLISFSLFRFSCKGVNLVGLRLNYFHYYYCHLLTYIHTYLAIWHFTQILEHNDVVIVNNCSCSWCCFFLFLFSCKHTFFSLLRFVFNTCVCTYVCVWFINTYLKHCIPLFSIVFVFVL